MRPVPGLSVALWSFDPPHRHPEGLAAAGVVSIEAGPDFILGRDPAAARQLADAYRTRGVRLRSVHAPFDAENLLSQVDAQKRRTAVEVHRRLFEGAAELGFSTIVVHPGGEVDEAGRAAAWECCRRSLEELLPDAESRGLRIALENLLPGGLGSDHDGLCALVEGFDSPAVGYCFDTGHAHVAGDVAGGYRRFAARLFSVHMHDNDGTRDMHLQPPYGTIPWPDLLAAMIEAPFDDEITLEMAPWRWAGYGWMLRELAALFRNGGRPAHLPGPGGRDYDIVCPRCGHYAYPSNGGAFCFCDRAAL